MQLQPCLKGELLELRPLREDDFEALYLCASDPEIWAQHPQSDRHERWRFTQFFGEAMASGGALLVQELGGGRILGSSRYHHYDPEAKEVEIGWTFLIRECWGGRYNRELKSLMLNHIFRWVERVAFRIGENNQRSRRATEKLGGEFRGLEAFEHGVWATYVISREAWLNSDLAESARRSSIT